MLGATNLFRWATSELSQDAFICWLLSWADRENAAKNSRMHAAGMTFLNALLANSGEPAVSKQTVVVRKQLASIDIVAEVGNSLILLIEDKTNTQEHGRQLEQYLSSLQSIYPGRKILPIFCKTGDQGSYEAPRAVGYTLFLRRDFIKALSVIDNDTLQSDIVGDFRLSLISREEAAQSYLYAPVEDWTRSAWEGFYLALQTAIPDLQWGYVANPRGGFMAAWWHVEVLSEWETYIQIEQDRLVMKMGNWLTPLDPTARAIIRDRWTQKLIASGKGSGISVEKPQRVGNGKSMTAAIIGKSSHWICRTTDSAIDLAATVSVLSKAANVLTKARINADLNPPTAA